MTVIAPQVSGFIATLAVTDQPVRAGDLPVRLDDRVYRAALAKADAAVSAEQATLARVAANRTLQLVIIAQAQAALDGGGDHADARRRRPLPHPCGWLAISTATARCLECCAGMPPRDTLLANGDTTPGRAMALKTLWNLTLREAQTLTHADAFLAIGCCFVVATMMVPLMRKVEPPKLPSADAHRGS